MSKLVWRICNTHEGRLGYKSNPLPRHKEWLPKKDIIIPLSEFSSDGTRYCEMHHHKPQNDLEIKNIWLSRCLKPTENRDNMEIILLQQEIQDSQLIEWYKLLLHDTVRDLYCYRNFLKYNPNLEEKHSKKCIDAQDKSWRIYKSRMAVSQSFLLKLKIIFNIP